MTEGNIQSAVDLESILKRLAESQDALLAAIKEANPKGFAVESDDGVSAKRSLERTVDDLNLYYGTLVAACLNLPQPPDLAASDFGTQREAMMALQVAQRRFTNLLHDVLPQDLERSATDKRHATYTLRQLLEMASAHYQLRVRQLAALTDRAAAKG